MRAFRFVFGTFALLRMQNVSGFVIPVSASKARTNVQPMGTVKVERLIVGPRYGKIDAFVDKIFTDVDVDKDAVVSLAETYELVLRLYILLNRQAPIRPPSRQKIAEIFNKADADGDGTIDREEFSTLMATLIRRASLRLVSHKSVSLLGAPLLVEVVVRLFLRRKWGFEMAQQILHPKLFACVSSVTFWRTLLLIFFVKTLGNAVVGFVTWCFDYSASIQQRSSVSSETIVK